jgi:hypothetical protein
VTFLEWATEDKGDSTKDSFYAELEYVFNQFQKYHMKTVRRFKCKQRQRRYFQNNEQE